MGNLTNPEQWAAQERLRFVEKCAFWRGVVNRQDLVSMYGISAAQATSDLQKYQEINPGSLIYNLNKKRYEGAPAMTCKMHRPRLEEAIALFLCVGDLPSALTRSVPSADREATNDFVAGVELPPRDAAPGVHRAIFRAVLYKLRVRVEYSSMSGKGAGWRWVAPHAFGHDGYRWHVRAWCEQNSGFRDFVLSRIKNTETPGEPASVEIQDVEWSTWIRVTVAPNSEFKDEGQKAIKADYGMTAGKLTFRVRKAMLDYTLIHLRLPTTKGSTVAAFLEVIATEEE